MPSVLVISPHFAPSAASGSFRMLGFAQHLPALGWDVSVVSCAGYPHEPVDPGLSDRVPRSVAVLAVDYPKLEGSRLLLSKLYRRTRIWDDGSAWSSAVWPSIQKVVRENAPDVILTSGPPHSVHLLGRRLKRQTGAAWAADFRDPWVTGKWNGVVSNILERRAERSVIAAADLVIANAPRARDAFCERYPQFNHKFITITNGYDAAPLPLAKPCPRVPIRMLHAGEIYAGRDPLPLLDALARSHAGFRRVEIEFLGRVSEMNVEDEACRRGLADRVRSSGQVSSAEANRAMAQADVQLLLDTPGRRIGVPAKLYEYMGSGRPILALAERDSDTAWALRESGVPHALAPPRDVDAITAALAKVIALAGMPISELPPQAARFTRANIANQLSEHLVRLLAPKSVTVPGCAAASNGKLGPTVPTLANGMSPPMSESYVRNER